MVILQAFFLPFLAAAVTTVNCTLNHIPAVAGITNDPLELPSSPTPRQLQAAGSTIVISGQQEYPTDFSAGLAFDSGRVYNLDFLVYLSNPTDLDFESRFNAFLDQILATTGWSGVAALPPTWPAQLARLQKGFYSFNNTLASFQVMATDNGLTFDDPGVWINASMSRQNQITLKNLVSTLEKVKRLTSIFSENINPTIASLNETLFTGFAAEALRNLSHLCTLSEFATASFGTVAISELAITFGRPTPSQQILCTQVRSNNVTDMKYIICQLNGKVDGGCAQFFITPDHGNSTTNGTNNGTNGSGNEPNNGTSDPEPPYGPTGISSVTIRKVSHPGVFTIEVSNFTGRAFNSNIGSTVVNFSPFSQPEQRQTILVDMGTNMGMTFPLSPLAGDIWINPSPACHVPLLFATQAGPVVVTQSSTNPLTLTVQASFIGIPEIQNGSTNAVRYENFSDPETLALPADASLANPRINLQQTIQSFTGSVLFFCGFYNVSANPGGILAFSVSGGPRGDAFVTPNSGVVENPPRKPPVWNTVLPIDSFINSTVPSDSTDRQMIIIIGNNTSVALFKITVHPQGRTYNFALDRNNRTASIILGTNEWATVFIANPSKAQNAQVVVWIEPIEASASTRLGLGLGIGLGIFGLLCVIGGGLFLYRRHQRKQKEIFREDFLQPKERVQEENDYLMISRFSPLSNSSSLPTEKALMSPPRSTVIPSAQTHEVFISTDLASLGRTGGPKLGFSQ